LLTEIINKQVEWDDIPAIPPPVHYTRTDLVGVFIKDLSLSKSNVIEYCKAEFIDNILKCKLQPTLPILPCAFKGDNLTTQTTNKTSFFKDLC
jgi:hypothetical protein